MLTSEERKGLQALLDHAVRPEEALTLDQLEGYLFGVVITPDVTLPSEWFADIFGEALASFTDGAEADVRFASLQQAYNRLTTLRLEGGLRFPFDLERVDPALLARVRDWAVGLDRALALRSWLWLPEEVLEQAEMEEADEVIMTCLMVVLGVAHPEKIPEIFEDVGARGEEVHEVWTSLVGELPTAVDMLLAHAGQLEAERLEGLSGAQAPDPAKRGRIEACPCGSGKKYKRCCGLN